MTDRFATAWDSPSAPATAAFAVVPHDVTPLGVIPKALYVGSGGDIAMRGVNDTADAVWKNVPGGTILPFRPRHVRATGTTATNLIAIY